MYSIKTEVMSHQDCIREEEADISSTEKTKQTEKTNEFSPKLMQELGRDPPALAGSPAPGQGDSPGHQPWATRGRAPPGCILWGAGCTALAMRGTRVTPQGAVLQTRLHLPGLQRSARERGLLCKAKSALET